MTINHTLNYLLAKRQDTLLAFSGQVTTGATYLKCAGGESGDGLPLPKPALIIGLKCWDGTALKSAAGAIEASAGDRVSLYASPSGGGMDLNLRLNGVDTTLVAAGLSQNATLLATLHLQLNN